MLLKRYRALVNASLTFKVEAHPPTQADLDARRAQLPVERLNQLGNRLVAGFLGIPLVCAMPAMTAANYHDVPGGEAVVIVALAVGAIGLMVTGFVLTIVDELHRGACRQRAQLEPLEQVCCGELLSACAASPEVEHYRTAVVAQGRQFVKGEFAALTAFAATANQRAACKSLYA